MADVRPLVIGSDFLTEEIQTADRLALPGLVMSGEADLGSNKITNLADATAATDAVTLQQVQALVLGRDPKENVVAVSVANETLSGLPTIDGVSPTAGQRVLLTGQSTGSENGIWEVQAGAWTRPGDFGTGSSAEGAVVSASGGSVFEGTIWVAVADVPNDVVDTDDPSFQQTSTSLSAGDGIDILGSVVSVDLSVNPGLQFVGGDLSVLLNGTTLAVGAAGLSVQGLPLQFQIDGVNVSTNVTSANVNTLVGGLSSDASALHTHSSVESAKEVREDLEVSEGISVGDPVEWSTVADQVRQARANAASRVDAFGVAITAQAVIGSDVSVVRLGLAEGVLAGATAGDRYWLGAAGGLATSPPGGVGNHIVFIGTAKNATDLEVKPQYIGRRGA